VGDASRARLLRALRDDPNSGLLALKVLERLEPALAPPALRAELDWRVKLIHRLEQLPTQTLERIIETDDGEEVYRLIEGGDLTNGRQRRLDTP
jgi:hypothetical protein